MGWASGSLLFTDIINILQPEILDKGKRKEVYKKLIEAFQEEDWDTENECLGKDTAYDAALEEMYPHDY